MKRLKADEKTLEEWVFDKQKAEVIFAVVDDEEIGFALFFHNFSTFLGRAGIYLEDLFVKPEYRGKDYGKAILKKLAVIAVERGCGRLEWWCLDGTSLVLISIFRWGQSLWMIGRYIGLLAIHCLILQAFEQWILFYGVLEWCC